MNAIWKGYFRVPEFLSFSTSEVLDVIDSLNLPKGSKVLDCGCGYGKISRRLYEKGFDVYAVDNSFEILTKIKEKLIIAREGFNIYCQDARNLSFDDSTFDLVMTDGLLEHFKDNEEIIKILKEEYRVSKKYVINFIPSRNKDWINLHQWVFPKAKNTKLSRLTALVCEVIK